jgi:hypothetical protein
LISTIGDRHRHRNGVWNDTGLLEGPSPRNSHVTSLFCTNESRSNDDVNPS